MAEEIKTNVETTTETNATDNATQTVETVSKSEYDKLKATLDKALKEKGDITKQYRAKLSEEERLSAEPTISEALVLGVDSSKGGMAVKAKIYPCIDKLKELYQKELSKEEIEKHISDLIEKINDRLPAYKKITIWEVVEEAFEKTTTNSNGEDDL